MIVSGTVRVTKAHIPLLERWHDLLSDPRYATLAEIRAHCQRGRSHVLVDQDPSSCPIRVDLSRVRTREACIC